MRNFSSQTILSCPHFDKNGVIVFRQNADKDAYLVYSVAQQAMLGRYFGDRYMGEGILGPYAEFVDIDHLPSPVGDPVAEAAACWLRSHATKTMSGTVVWLHDFDFTFMDGDSLIPKPWVSAIGQANALLACLHWWRHTGEDEWLELASGAVASFNNPSSTRTGVAYRIDEDSDWFEEYPTLVPSHILNCHLLSLIALERAGRIDRLSFSTIPFERGWRALINRIGHYDRKEWSRYDTYDHFFLFLRLLPSVKGLVALGRVELQTASGLVIRHLDASSETVSDKPISRIAGIDWGIIKNLCGKAGRIIPNCQEKYAQEIPEGGTDQNTYLIFEEERLPAERWLDSGVKLTMEVFLSSEAQLTLQFQDLLKGGLNFLADQDVAAIQGEGWHEVSINIPHRLIGRILPRHYHILHTELLGTLLALRPDKTLEEIFRRWHISNLSDFQTIMPINSEMPQNIYVNVNDRCGLRCKMCDVGERDPKAIFFKNLTEKGRELDPEMLIRALREFGSNAKNVTLCITGTEPLMYSHLLYVLKMAKYLGMRTQITTNGLLLHKRAEELAGEVDQVTISIDGPPHIRDEVRRLPGLFKKISDGIEILKQTCEARSISMPILTFSFAISKDNHLHVVDFMESIQSFQPHSITISHLNYVAPQSAEKHNISFPTYPIMPSSLAAWEETQDMDYFGLFLQLEYARNIKWTDVHIIPYCPTPTRLQWYYQRPELPMSRPSCAAPFWSVQILADGSISVLGRCYDVTMGNIAEHSLKDIWNGDNYFSIRTFLTEHPYLEACMRCCGSL